MAKFDIPWDAVHGYELNTTFRTEITDIDAGCEQRRAVWANPRRAWALQFRKDTSDTAAIIAFFEAHKGRYRAFDWEDPAGILRRVRFMEDTLKASIVGGISVIQFTLIEVFDTDVTPPTIESVSPPNGGSSGGADTNVIWTFSEAISPADVTPTYFHVIDTSTGASVPGVLSIGSAGKTVTFDPAGSWVVGRVYNARVEAGVHDLAGNQLAAAYGSLFAGS